ncbi:MAG: class I SAM-dependent RNA methyltransferase [Firmicutes bacterium]|nr:class I SAM-dependent RNA methyltransferase [Bacillota bacterium]
MIVKIERMDHLGNGIGYLNGKIIFVPKTISGDIVKILNYEEHKKYSQAIDYELISLSQERVEAFCPYYEKCGGCHLQNMTYEDTLEYKKNRVHNILAKAGITNDIEVIANQNDKYYRNKIELKIKNGKLGFYEKKTHKLTEVESCAITKKAINNFLPELLKMNIQNGEVTLRCNYNDELLIAIQTDDKIILNEDVYPKYKVVGIILNNTCIYGEKYFLDKINNMFFEISYDAFFQVNSYINSQLFDLISQNCKGATVLDLYSGVGTLSLMASLNAKNVYAIENIPNAVVNAMKNAKINNVNNVKFILGNVEDKIQYIDEKIDTVIVDPPRRGLDNITINKILSLSPAKIIYISCETQKLAEDLKKLQEKYEVNKLSILDMFSYTYHVECVTVLNLKK